jgi:GH15 family glucan-1,4-alpha-glucosidase
VVPLGEQTDVALSAVRDSTGVTDVEQYAVLGDGRGVALVAADGCVDWWAAPHLDSPPVVSTLLEPGDGGTVSLRPRTDEARVRRRYLPDTNVLETTYTTTSGRVSVTDALNTGNAGALPWTELARQVEGLEGRVEMSFELRPGDGLRRWQPWRRASA